MYGGNRYADKNIIAAYDHLVEYDLHQKKLLKIKKQMVKSQLQKTDVSRIDLMRSKMVTNKMKTSEFQETRKQAEIKKENEILLRKLMGIASGSTHKPQRNTLRPGIRSLNALKMKKQAAKIDYENQQILKRILTQVPMIPKKKMDEEFKQTNQYRTNIQRSQKLTAEQIFKKRNMGIGYLPAIHQRKSFNNSSANQSLGRTTSRSHIKNGVDTGSTTTREYKRRETNSRRSEAQSRRSPKRPKSQSSKQRHAITPDKIRHTEDHTPTGEPGAMEGKREGEVPVDEGTEVKEEIEEQKEKETTREGQGEKPLEATTGGSVHHSHEEKEEEAPNGQKEEEAKADEENHSKQGSYRL